MQDEPVFEVLWPLAPVARSGAAAAAAGPVALDGKRVAFISFSGFRREQMYDLLREGLTERFSDVELISYDEFGDIHGADDKAVFAALPARLAEVRADAAIIGTGA
jgi:hypothetical protein